MSSSRQLAAIMFTDIVGYTALMQQNEERALAVIKHYNTALDKAVKEFNGRVTNYYGDGSLCLFPSATEAANCALAVQRELKLAPVVPLRIGLHIGEVFYEDGKALGDGVNVASRVQSLGQENTILVSAEFHDKIKNNPSITTRSLGLFDFKNVHKPMEVYALTNDGLTVPQRRKMTGKLRKKTTLRQYLVWTAVVIGIAVVGDFLNQNYFTKKTPAAITDKSIAVLPFVDMSPGKDQEYLGDGLAEEIINSIAAIRSLKVIGRTSSFQYKGKGMDARGIGEDLKVSYILEGSIQKSGNELRITTQLIRVKDNTTIWSKRFDKELKDIFAIQDSIANNIVSNLELTLTASERPRLIKKETDPETYSNYLKGLYTYKAEDWEKSLGYHLLAVASDSLFAPPYAYVALSKTWIINQKFDYADFNAIREAKAYANKSIQLDPELAEGYSALGLLAWSVELDFPVARVNFEKSIQLNPSASLVKNRYAYFLLWMGEFDKAEELGLDAISSDPADYNGYVVVSRARIHKKRFREAEKSIAEGQRLFPNNRGLKQLAIDLQFSTGKYDQVIQTLSPGLAKLDTIPINQFDLLAIALYRKNRLPESRAVIKLLTDKPAARYSSRHCSLARIYAQYGLKDSCFFHLEKSFTDRETEFRQLKIDPLLEPVRTDPRYGELYHRYGFDLYQ